MGTMRERTFARGLRYGVVAVVTLAVPVMAAAASHPSPPGLAVRSVVPLRYEPGYETGGGSGAAVALSADGDTVLVGTPNLDDGNGGAWVLVRSGARWSTPVRLVPKGASVDAVFGSSVALSANGRTALVGDQNQTGPGAAWVFVREGQTWIQEGELVPRDAEGRARFGEAVALSGDGDTALIGGIDDDHDRGAAWIFQRSGDSWRQQGPKLVASGEVGAGALGTAVALSSDGDTALIAASNDNTIGAAYVFSRTSQRWAQQGLKLVPSNAAQLVAGLPGTDMFASSVSLSGNGSTALIGGEAYPARPNALYNGGSAWIFQFAHGHWRQEGPRLSVTRSDTFGWAVALSSSGRTGLISDPYYDNGAGQLWVVIHSDNAWHVGRAFSLDPPQPEGSFGWSIALSAHGTSAIVGEPRANDSTGAVWELG